MKKIYNKFLAVIYFCLPVYSVYANELPVLKEENFRFDTKQCRILSEQKIFCRVKNDAVAVYDLEKKLESKMYEKETENQPHSFYQYQCNKVTFGLLEGNLVARCDGSTRRFVLYCFTNENVAITYDEDGVETFKSNVFWKDNNKCRELFQITKNEQMGIVTKAFLDSLKKQ